MNVREIQKSKSRRSCSSFVSFTHFICGRIKIPSQRYELPITPVLKVVSYSNMAAFCIHSFTSRLSWIPYSYLSGPVIVRSAVRSPIPASLYIKGYVSEILNPKLLPWCCGVSVWEHVWMVTSSDEQVGSPQGSHCHQGVNVDLSCNKCELAKQTRNINAGCLVLFCISDYTKSNILVWITGK